MRRKNDLPYHECSSFENCSAPMCPLDPLYSERYRFPEEEKCRAHKPSRVKIGQKYHKILPHLGLLPNEWNGYRNAGYSDTEIVPKILGKGGNRLKTR